MKNNLFATVVLCLTMFMVVSCDPDLTVKTATYYVHNNSQLQITEVFVSSRAGIGFQEILESGENCTLLSEWVESTTAYSAFHFKINGEEYGTREYEEAMTDTVKFKPYKRVTDGDTITVHIYDDHWEWWTVE